MPKRVTLKRRWWAWRNTVDVYDRRGDKILTMRAKYVEWGHLDRAWRFSGANLYLEKKGVEKRGWSFNSVAFMSGDHDKIGTSSGTPYDLTITDCNGDFVSQTHSNEIYGHLPMTLDTKAGFFTISTGAPEANEAIIFDLSVPDPKPQVKFTQGEPCWLFPFCTYLTDRGWMAMLPWVAASWDAEVVMKGYGQDIAKPLEPGSDTEFQETMGANAAIDIRFLALWSFHVFGASKFSRIQQLLAYLVFGGLFVWCCARCCFPPKKEAPKEVEEDPDMEVYASANADGSNQYSSPWNCCSRKRQYDGYIAGLNSKKPSELARELRSQGATQGKKEELMDKEVNECYDSPDIKQTFIEKISGMKTKNMNSTRRGALE
jgi:hypothetical protein